TPVWDPSLLALTAQALLAEVALALRSWSFPSGVGLDTTDQCVPFHCKIRVWSAVAVLEVPAAQALLVEVTARPGRVLLGPEGPGGGLGTTDPCVPFHGSR